MRFPKWDSKYYAFNGGLDLVSPPITIKPGVLRSASNFEIGVNGGYTRIAGYERFSGKASPSAAEFQNIDVTITGAVSAGNVITGATSGATATVIAASSAVLYITNITGTFQAEVLNVGGNPQATSSGANYSGLAPNTALNATYKNLAADVYRALIAEVPGSGSILGVHQFNGKVYAFRNNAGGTAAVMHQSSASGWAAIALGRELSFTSGGTTAIAVGDAITGATSAATAVIAAITVETGSWAAGTAAGRFIFASQTGTFQSENINVGASPNLATIAGNSSAITLAPGGRYDFVNHNFGGTAGQTKMYGCSGVHRAFEFDGTTFVPIATGMTSDAPEHIAAFKKHLFLTFDGSVQHSGIGTPYTWSVITGASEIAVGDQCTGLVVGTGGTSVGAMFIYTRNQTFVLYGNSSADWNLVSFSPDTGAITWTPQFIGQGILLDDRGITTTATSQNFGNFNSASVSKLVNPYLLDRRDRTTASCVVRDKNQYRLFFLGGEALYVTLIDNKIGGFMSCTLAHAVSCISSSEAANGVEEIYFGSTNGFVYQMDVGTSFDGDPIPYSIELAYNHLGSPRQLKQFHKLTCEVSGSGYNEFSLGYSLGYGNDEIPQPNETTVASSLAPAYWDSFTWDQFVWDGVSLTPADIDLDGMAENISLIFSGDSDEFDPFTINGAIISYTQRRGLR